MAKTLSEAPVTTVNARSKLAEGLHWRGIDADVHLGYRKGKRTGKWMVRWYEGAGRYRQAPLGTANDVFEADGVNTLSFDQAKSRAVETVRLKRLEARAAAQGPAPTIRSAVEAYIAVRETREGRKRDARLRLTKHVLNDTDLVGLHLHSLTQLDLEKWREAKSRSLAPATVRRLINDLKAALNAAGARNRTSLPVEFANVVKDGLTSSNAAPPRARDAQALSDEEVRRIIECSLSVDEEDGWEGDLYRMIIVLAATGARFSQVARMLVADVQPSRDRLMVPLSRKGKGQKNSSHVAVRVGADVLSALRPAIAGRRGTEALLERWRHKQVAADADNPPRWIRDARGLWLSSSEITRPWAKISKKAGLPADVVPYALRHSSIVRQLRMGLPVRLVAAFHDTSAGMIEAHYSAAIVDALDELAAGAVIPLAPEQAEKVVQLRR